MYRVILIIMAFCLFFFSKNVVEKNLTPYIQRAPSLFEKNARYHANSLKKYNLGFGLVISDLIWIRLLQNARHTEIEKGKVSWEFSQLDAITTLDPKFIRAYEFGAAFLSVFLRDNTGAKIILEKWVDKFPNSWRAHYLLGYHLFYEMKDYSAAAPHIIAAAKRSGAPSWLHSLGIRIFSETGRLTQALSLAISLLDSISDSEGRDRLILRIKSLKYNIELGLWKDALEKYRQINKKEPINILDLKPYKQQAEREIASILSDSVVPKEIYDILNEKYYFKYNGSMRTIEPVNDVPEQIKQFGLNKNG